MFSNLSPAVPRAVTRVVTTQSSSQAKVDAAAKWMEAVKGMEALAAFSRRKIKNFEAVHKNKKMMMDSDDEEDASAE